MNPKVPPIPEVPKWILTVVNHLYEVETKLRRQGDSSSALRNVEKMKDAIASEGVFFEDPFGQDFKETRTDLEATITGEGTEQLRVVEVIKPIIRIGNSELSRVVQKGIVVVQATS